MPTCRAHAIQLSGLVWVQFMVYGLGFRVSSLGFRVQSFGVQGLGFRVQGLGFRVQGLVYGLRIRVQGFEFRVQGLGSRVLGFRVHACGLVQPSNLAEVQCIVSSRLTLPLPLASLVQGLGFRVQGLGFRVQGLGFSVQCLGFSVSLVLGLLYLCLQPRQFTTTSRFLFPVQFHVQASFSLSLVRGAYKNKKTIT